MLGVNEECASLDYSRWRHFKPLIIYRCRRYHLMQLHGESVYIGLQDKPNHWHHRESTQRKYDESYIADTGPVGEYKFLVYQFFHLINVKVLDYSLHTVILLHWLHNLPHRSLGLFIPDSISTHQGAYSLAAHWCTQLIN